MKMSPTLLPSRRPPILPATRRITASSRAKPPIAASIVPNFDNISTDFSLAWLPGVRAAPGSLEHRVRGCYFGQDASIASRVAFVDLPRIQSVLCVQNEYAPTDGGMRSAPP